VVVLSPSVNDWELPLVVGTVEEGDSELVDEVVTGAPELLTEAVEHPTG